MWLTWGFQRVDVGSALDLLPDTKMKRKISDTLNRTILTTKKRHHLSDFFYRSLLFVMADLGSVYARSVRFGHIWIGSTLARVLLNCVGFTPVQYHPGMVQFQTGSISQVNPFGTRQENQSRTNLPAPI